MNESSVNSSHVNSKLVVKLIQNLCPTSKNADSLHSYCMRVLSSRMNVAVDVDEFRLMEIVKKKVNREIGGVEKAARISELHNKLLKRPILHKRWSVIYALYALSMSKGEEANLRNTSSYSLEEVGLSSIPTIHITSKENGSNNNYTNTSFANNSNINGNHEDKSIILDTSLIHYKLEPGLSFEVSEQLLVRDLLFVFQGIDGRYIKFNSKNDSYSIAQKIALPTSTRNLVFQLSEIGWLYKKICSYIDRQMKSSSLGLVGQSFCCALQGELADYYRLIAILEAQVNSNAAFKALDEGKPQSLYSSSYTSNQMPTEVGTGNEMTLRRLMVWMSDPMERLRIMASLSDSTEGLRGGALASAIHSHIFHGDPSKQQFLQRLVSLCSAPLYEMIRKWIIDGELQDGFEEFWVKSNLNVSEGDLWSKKYSFQPHMKPAYISEETASQILLIGKSINFIRLCCHDSEWVMDSGAVTEEVEYTGDDGSKLTELVNATGHTVNQRLLKILFDKYKLMDHLGALRRFLLMGQGDFLQYLMDRLAPELAKKATSIYRHNLTAVLETAIRASNVQYESSDIVERLDVRMMEASPGDSGWDVFSLDYRVDGPVTAVISTAAQEKYQQIFTFLWQMKRVDYSLSKTWRSQMLGDKRIRDISSLVFIVQKSNLLRNEMQHFVSVFHNYVMFEVLQKNWKQLATSCESVSDLDQLIAAHELYLANILDQTLAGRKDILHSTLISLFDIILRFSNIQQQLYSAAVAEVHRQGRVESDAVRNNATGKWGVTDVTDQENIDARVDLDRLVREMTNKVNDISASYTQNISMLITQLRKDNASVANFRFLAFRLDFNEYYQNLST